MSVAALETHDLTVTYHKRPVLYGVDVAIPEGSLVGIVGPNKGFVHQIKITILCQCSR